MKPEIVQKIDNHENKVESALAIVGPVQRFGVDREDEIIQNLLEATLRIS